MFSDIANNLMNNKIALTRKNNLSQDATKDILFHINKIRSLNGKKVDLKKINFDRYQSIQSQQVVELNLKFPRKSEKKILQQCNSIKEREAIICIN
jgi:hypothetical protein